MSKSLPINDDMHFDVRVVPHKIRRNELAQSELEAHLAELPDEADEAVPSEIVFTTPFADRLRREGGKA